jgi:hypothetical protein
MGDLSAHFSRSEFACKCGCGFDDVKPDLIEALEALRAILNALSISTAAAAAQNTTRKSAENATATT